MIHLQGPGAQDERRLAGPIDATRVASVDLLIPTYRSRARDTVRVGDVVTTEVPGLAEALRRPGIEADVEIVLTDGATIGAHVLIPDAASTLGLKAWARTVRQESGDAEDLWCCLEIALADGVTADTLHDDATLAQGNQPQDRAMVRLRVPR